MADALEAAVQLLGEGRLTSESLRELVALGQRAVAEHAQLEELVEHVPAVLYIDKAVPAGTEGYPTVYVGPQVEAVLGITRQSWIEDDDLWERHMHPDDWPTASGEYHEYLLRGGVLVQEYRMIRPDNGATVWVRDDCSMVEDPISGEQLVLGVMFDITRQKELEEQLRAAQAKNLALIDQVPGIVWIEPLDPNPEPAFVSAAVREVFGVERKEWLETSWWEEHLHPDDHDRVLKARRAAVAKPHRLHIEYRMRTATGRAIWIEEISEVVMHDGRPWILQGLLDDITSRKKAEQKLEFRAFHDPLTGLANRPLFDQSLEQALERARRQDSEIVVLFVDVDHFKQVNDAFGHDAGDQVLREIATRLQACARASDLVARRGGDEFLLLLTDISGQPPSESEESPGRASEATRCRGDLVAERITRRILDAMSRPMLLNSGPVTMSLSIGKCVYPWDATDLRAMMSAADASMYDQKPSQRTD